MSNTIKRNLFLAICSVFIVSLLLQTASADSISLHKTLFTNLDKNWELGDIIQINAYTPEMGPNPSYKFSLDTVFSMETDSYSDRGLYSGHFEIKNSDKTFLSANFYDLEASFTFSSSTGSFFTRELEAIDFSANDFANITGGLVVDALESLFFNARWSTNSILQNGIEIKKSQFFTGTISGQGLQKPIPNPEPATFFLFGFGLLGIAGIGRQRHMN